MDKLTLAKQLNSKYQVLDKVYTIIKGSVSNPDTVVFPIRSNKNWNLAELYYVVEGQIMRVRYTIASETVTTEYLTSCMISDNDGWIKEGRLYSTQKEAEEHLLEININGIKRIVEKQQFTFEQEKQRLKRYKKWEKSLTHSLLKTGVRTRDDIKIVLTNEGFKKLNEQN